MRVAWVKCLAMIGVLSTPLTASAQMISIDQGKGHGLLFRNGGRCYAVTANHVAPGDAPISVSIPNRAETGFGHVLFRRPGADLAVAEIVGQITELCTLRWSSLAARATTPDLGAVDLPRISPSGTAETLTLKLASVAWQAVAAPDGPPAGHYRYLILTAPEGARIHPGTSGAFVFRNDVPLGMILNALPPNRARALSMEEIAGPVGRWLATRTLVPRMPVTTAPVAGGLAFSVVGFVEPASSPAHTALALAGGGTYRYSGAARETAVELRFPKGVTALGKIIIGHPGGSPEGAPPPPPNVVVHTRSGGRYEPYTTVKLPQNGSQKEISVPVRTDGVLLQFSGAFGAQSEIEIGPITVLPYQ